MSVLVVSVSHKSTSVAQLADLALDAAAAVKLADQLLTSEHIDEAVVLATCNRTEIYASVSRFHGALDDATDALADLGGLSVADAAGPLRGLLRRGRRRPHLRRRRRAGLGGDRGEPDPRPGEERAHRRPVRRHGRHRAQRPVPAGAAGRQAGAGRDRDRQRGPLPGQRGLPAADRRARPARRPAGPGRRRRRHGRAGRAHRRGGRRRGDLCQPHPGPGPAARRRRRRPGRPADRAAARADRGPTCWSPAPAPAR